MSNDLSTRFSNAAIVTLDEVRPGPGGTLGPVGTAPYEVQPNDNLWRIAVQHGYGDPPDMHAFYSQNPQFLEAERNPDLIFPGEVVFVTAAPGTLEATVSAYRQLQNAREGNEGGLTNAAVQAGERAFETAINLQLDARIDPDATVQQQVATIVAEREAIIRQLEQAGASDSDLQTVRSIAQELINGIRWPADGGTAIRT